MSAAPGRSRGPSIVFFGLFGVGNLGNDASLGAVLDAMRVARPDARYACIAPFPDLLTERWGIRAASLWAGSASHGRLGRIVGLPRSVARAWSFLRDQDVMIVPGTGLLDDFGERPRDMPLHLFAWTLLARLAGVEILLLGIGAGPVRHRLSRYLMLRAARRASLCSVRDEPSRRFLDQSWPHGGSAPEVCPDVVFARPLPPPPVGEGSSIPVVGVGVMSYFGWDGQKARDRSAPVYQAYVARTADLVDRLLDAGWRVRLLHGEGGDVAAMHDITAVVDAMGAHRREDVECRDVQSFDELLEAIADVDVLVAARFHNVVAGVTTGRPVVSLGYAEKNDALMGSVGLGRFCHDIERFDVATVVSQVRELLADRAVVSRRVRQRAEELHAEAIDHVVELARRL